MIIPAHKKQAKRVLIVCGVDVMAWCIVRPFIEKLLALGFDVEIACKLGAHEQDLRSFGVPLHDIEVSRSLNPALHVRPILQLRKLLRDERFDIVNAHGVLAAYLTRAAALSGRACPILYYVHGFYFHEAMNPIARAAIVAVERLLGRVTGGFVFVSAEDAQTADRLRIKKPETPSAIAFNSVSPELFRPALPGEAGLLRASLNIASDVPVVGIVGRIVREKGYREFLDMAAELVSSGRDVRFLVVGDNLSTDRDQFGAQFKHDVEQRGLQRQFVFAGFVPDVHRYLRMMDIFVLPSYREGFPKSVLEAMATSLPVVATNIRGCREAITQGETGFIVPPREARGLTNAVASLLNDAHLRQRMGSAGLKRLNTVFSQQRNMNAFLDVFHRTCRPAGELRQPVEQTS